MNQTGRCLPTSDSSPETPHLTAGLLRGIKCGAVEAKRVRVVARRLQVFLRSKRGLRSRSLRHLQSQCLGLPLQRGDLPFPMLLFVEILPPRSTYSIPCRNIRYTNRASFAASPGSLSALPASRAVFDTAPPNTYCLPAMYSLPSSTPPSTGCSSAVFPSRSPCPR